MGFLDPTFSYSADLQARFECDGYLIFDRFLSEDGLARCRRECDAMLDRRHPDRPPEMIISAHVRERWLFELVTEPALLDLVAAHIGPNLLLWSTHMLCKPPGHGRSIPWHQDASYFNIEGEYPPTIWIVFDDVDEENGGLTVLPGQHRRGVLPTVPSGRTDFEKTIDIEAEAPGVEPVHYRMRAGQLAMHHARLPHASPPNRSDRWRRVVTASYVPADAKLAPRTYRDYVTDEPFDRQFYLVRGEAPEGAGFPTHPEWT